MHIYALKFSTINKVVRPYIVSGQLLNIYHNYDYYM